jgi:Xaa-Pro aminopeptidase
MTWSTRSRRERQRRGLLAAALVAVVAAALVTRVAQGRARQPNAEYAQRRTRLLAQVDGPVVLFGYTGNENTLEFLRFQQEENFYYLTGHNEEGAAMVLVPEPPSGKSYSGPREILFLPAKNPGKENWNGGRQAPTDPGITETTGFASVEAFANLERVVGQLAKVFPRFYTLLPGRYETGYPHAQVWSDWLRKAAPGVTLADGTQKIAALRQIKSAAEIALLIRAVEVSVDAHLEAMKLMRPGLYEYQVAARMQFLHMNAGCLEEAYAPIVGAGINSTALHYDALESKIEDGDVVVLDVACAQDGYAADITRTLPASGHFSPRQREIYEIVLGAQNAAIAAVKPGARMSRDDPRSPVSIAFEYINTHGKDREGGALGKYYIHGLSHPIGLDVHDPYLPNRPLEPGMVITIEPGIYIPQEKLGVRIEDDVLVTDTGAKVLSARLPRATEDVEALMAHGNAAPAAPAGPDRSKIAANEAAAVASLRTLNTACRTYSLNYSMGFPEKLSYLGNLDSKSAGGYSPTTSGLIGNDLAQGTKDGYVFLYSSGTTMRGMNPSYTIHANPVSPGQSGVRYFFTDQSGVIRINSSQPASKSDPPI